MENEKYRDERRNYLTVDATLVPKVIVEIMSNEGQYNLDPNELRRYFNKKRENQ